MLCYRGVKRSYSHARDNEDAGLGRPTKKTSEFVKNATANTPSIATNGEANHAVHQDSASTETCFGMVITARVGPIGSSRLPKCLRFSQQGRIPLRFHVETDLITVLLAINEGEVESDEKVGALDDYHTSVILKLRAAVPSIQFRPFLAEDPVDIRSGVKIVPVSCSIEIVLYGVRADIDRVGSIFTDARIHLQEPDYIEPHVVYHNPHVLWWEDDFGTPRFKLWGPVDDEEEAKAIVTAAEPLPPALETERHDPRIRTTLYGHQMLALKFMIDRESETICDDSLSLWQPVTGSDRQVFIHTITGEKSPKRPTECRGGLLADEMGMGKSLSVLSLVVKSLGESLPPGRQTEPLHTLQPQLVRSKATLIVAPKPVLSAWINQIETHTTPGALRTHVYHGRGVSENPSLLVEFDVVLTTYGTVISDRDRHGALGKVFWFRIILDEAHCMRNPSTKGFQALGKLEAERRWCLTGTPIQNKLADIFSLTRFLRFSPFDTPSGIQKHVTEPLGRRDETGLKNLRLMMKAFALRRSKTGCINTRRYENTILVNLTPAERREYSSILTRAKKDLLGSGSRGPSHTILQSVLRLRQLCSHGYPRASKQPGGLHAGGGGCDSCGTDSRSFSPTLSATGTVCRGHRICPECSLEYINSLSGTPSAVIQSCPICGECPALSQENMDIDSSTDGDGDTTMGGVEDELYPGSTRSKISEVVSNLVKPDQTSTSNTGKHLVFSCWTTTLDHLEDALVARRLQFVRIDGKRSDTQRESAIDSFQSDPGLRVMLLSIGVGSAGLNLTAASHVHIVEPQWNPMVEEQAAARVHRIGQERDVSIIRYIVKDSIEERIRDRQKHKLKVAEGANASQDSIEDIRDLRMLLS